MGFPAVFVDRQIGKQQLAAAVGRWMGAFVD
jgi:hypothetical protein